MNIIDSSMWLEYFADTPNGDVVEDIIENANELIVPTITIYEVFKKLLLEADEDKALLYIMQMREGNVIQLSDELSLLAAKISKDHKLPMADSIIYATTIQYNSVLWTQDKHFSGLQSVNYFEKIQDNQNTEE